MERWRGLRASHVLALCVFGLFVAGAVVSTVLTDRNLRVRAREEAEAQALLMLDHNLAIHTYFSHDLKPTLFKTLDPIMGKDYFEPRWMSSTYAVRDITEHLLSLSEDGYYYKECAIDARSPENEADPFEADFLRRLNEEPDLDHQALVRELEGEPYLAVLRRGETMAASCIRCHDTPERAPTELVAHYGAERSFGRHEGDVVSAVSMRIPLAEAYAKVDAQTLTMSIEFVILLLVLMGAYFVLTQRLLLTPLNTVRSTVEGISTDPARLGERMPQPWGREFAGLTDAFNRMSTALRAHRDGLEATVQERTAALEEANVNLRGEVREREAARVALAESEARYRGLFQGMFSGFAVHEVVFDGDGNPTDLRYLEVNPAFERITGLRAEDAVGKTMGELLPETDPEWFADLGQVAVGGGAITRERYHPELRRHFELAAYQVGDGRLAVIFRDITKRKLDEAALRDREQRFRALFEQAGDYCLILEPRPGGLPVILEANEATFALHGMQREEVMGQPVSVLCPEKAHGSLAAYDRCLSNGDAVVFEALHQRRDGRAFMVEASAKRVITGLDKPLIFSIEYDISERLNLEEQLRQAQKLEAVGQLAGGVAHDFNNLLYVIQGFSEMTLDQVPADSPAAENVDEVLKATERASTLVRQLLGFSRRQVLNLADVDLNRLVQGLAEMLRRVIGEHIELRFLPGHALGTVHVDPGQIEQVIMNLCVNARDAMPTGGTLSIETENVSIGDEYVDTHPWSKPGLYVLVSVTDTGCGMDAETLASIYEPFFTTKGVGQGSGLGLSMVYGLVKQHEGMVYAYSEVGKGTTFKVYLPIVERGVERVAAKVTGRLPHGTETVLLAEDDNGVRGLSKTILERAGYHVIDAADGTAAVACFEQHADRIDLAILDVMMPGLGGREVYEHIRARRPDVKVLFSSGYSMNAIHTNFVLDEGLRLLQKPYRREVLLRMVREVLED